MINNLDSFLKPESVAVIGASEKKASLGRELFNNILEFGYTGKLYPINPKSETILGIKAYESLLDIPEKVDLAIILVPKPFVLKVIDECGKKQIKSVIIITAGFKEIGGEGINLENEIKKKLKEYNIKAIGPNCMGIINTSSEVSLSASFAEDKPLPGGAAFVSQSGAIGAALLNIANDLNLKISQFVSLGNKIDLDESSFLEYWADSPDVNQILLYLESVEDIVSFKNSLEGISPKKPVIILKAGSTEEGSKAASSHTGALANSMVSIDSAIKQTGAIKADNLMDLFYLSQTFANCPIPKGKNIGIITNAGGPGVLATDSLSQNGFCIASLQEHTKNSLKEFLPDNASINNPVDMIASSTTNDYISALDLLYKDNNVDIIMVIFLAIKTLDLIENSKAIMNFKNSHPDKPIVGVSISNTQFFNDLSKIDRTIPFYQCPDIASKCLYKLYEYGQFLKKENVPIKEYAIDTTSIDRIFSIVKQEKRCELTTYEAIQVLDLCGIPLTPYMLVNSLEDCILAAKDIGYPLVLKISSKQISHKTEIGGVVVNITNEEDLKKEYIALMKKLEKLDLIYSLEGLVLQKMIKGSREIFCGQMTGNTNEKLISFGTGGTYIELMKDAAFRINPLTEVDAYEMIMSTKAAKLLNTFRGLPAAKIETMQDILLRLSYLISTFPCIAELDINPIIIANDTSNIYAVDSRVKILK